jgi:hypothetical protein
MLRQSAQTTHGGHGHSCHVYPTPGDSATTDADDPRIWTVPRRQGDESVDQTGSEGYDFC